jgi:hypothetical protein
VSVFFGHLGQTIQRALPYGKQLDPLTKSLIDKSLPRAPTPPGVPSPNDAANAAQQQADMLRMRRGMLSNIYAGAMTQQPVAGKVQLGT